MAFNAGENVGSYRIMEQLGQGGMATVFKAYHAALDRDVAIKVLHPTFKNDPQFFERFKREAQIVAKLEHPNIIPVYDFSEHNGEPYLVMRYVQGHTLKAHLQDTPLPAETILGIMQPMCAALTYAHQQGVLHRDIKPSNIILAQDGNLFLADFGLARMTQAGESTLSHDMMVGTPKYISPEQAQGDQDLSTQTDVYSLGIVLFEMLTGTVPYQGDTPFAVVHDHIYKPLPLPRTVNANIDSQAEKVILKALAKDPKDRFRTVSDLWQALDAALAPLANQKGAVNKGKLQSARKPKLSLKRWVITIGVSFLILMLCVGLIRRNRRLREADANVEQPIITQMSQGSAPVIEPILTDVPPGDAPSPDNTIADTVAKAAQLRHDGIALIRAGKSVEGVKKLNQAIERHPQNLQNYYDIARVVGANRPQQAVPYLETATQVEPNNGQSWLLLGFYQLRSRSYTQALASFTQAQTLVPENSEPYIGLAMVFIFEEEFAAAEEQINQVKSSEPDNPNLLLVEGFFYWRQGKLAEAQSLLRQANARKQELLPLLRADLNNALRTICQESPAHCPTSQ